MSMEEDLHMALCVVKVIALVVIASALMSISGGLSGPSYGYASNPYLSVSTSNAGKSFNVTPEANNVGSSSYLGPGYGAETSQAYFSARYEPPTFWNIGDINSYESVQSAAASSGPMAAGSYDQKGYATNGLGVALKRGYATNLPNGGVTASGVPLTPY
jgi:hypothetical protein